MQVTASGLPEKITIRAVAQHAGVSAMTVSNVINGTRNVSAEKAERVLASAAALGYVPNVAARSLANARATKIGLLYSVFRVPFLDALLVGALRAANARGMQLILHECPDVALDTAVQGAHALKQSGADALLAIPPFAELLSGTPILSGLGLPVAAIATGYPLPDISTVRLDNRVAMRELTAFVLAKGHRRIGFVAGPERHSDGVQRALGFRDALTEAGLPFDPALSFAGRFDYKSGVEAAEYFLVHPIRPTAIICSNDEMAAGVAARALGSGLRLPEELSITGFDDTQLASRMWPPLTVIRQPVEQMAYAAVDQLIVAFSGKSMARSLDLLLPHDLIDRGSVLSVSG